MYRLAMVLCCMGLASVTWGGQVLADLTTVEDMIEEGALEEAVARLEPLVQQKQDTPRSYYLLARAQLELGNFEEAEKWGQKAVDADKQNPAYWTQLGNIKGLRARDGSKLKALGRAKGASKAYDKALELDPTHAEALISKLRYKLYAPGFVGGDKDESRHLAESLLAAHPARGHLARAEIFIYADKDSAAYRAELVAAAQVAEDAATLYEIANYHLQIGDDDKAWACHRQGIARDESPDQGKVRLASRLLSRGLLDEAEEILRGIKIRGASGPRAALGLALVALRRGQDEEAWNRFQEVVQVYPDYPPGKYYLGEQHLLARDDAAAALPLLQEYLSGFVRRGWPPRAVAHWRLAVAHEKLRNFDKAWEHAQLARELGLSTEQFESDERRIKFMAED